MTGGDYDELAERERRRARQEREFRQAMELRDQATRRKRMERIIADNAAPEEDW